ncbi:MAG: ThuA domain-containing protein, partial [Bacteroidota bacterium]
MVVFLFFLCCSMSGQSLTALIIDGQNNHDMWPKTTMMMRQYLMEAGFEKVDIARTQYTWRGEKYLTEYSLSDKKYEALEQPKADLTYKPDFEEYDLVLTNFGWRAAPWPASTQKAFEDYLENGGGLVVVHAADNSFPDWPAYNKMIGLGGWGGRTEKDGPYVYYDDQGKLQRDFSEGRGGSHGPEHEFKIKIRRKHPITKGMPSEWLHAQDELYDRLRGPAEKMKVLATAYSSGEFKGTQRHEPILMVLRYGKGRIFHTPLGHADYSMECVGFIVSLQRGAQ